MQDRTNVSSPKPSMRVSVRAAPDTTRMAETARVKVKMELSFMT